MHKPVVLTIAGSDPTGGAGLQADLKTFAVHGVYGVSAVSAITAQNSRCFEVFPVPAATILAQIGAVFDEFDIEAVKIGMLADRETVGAVIEALERHNGDGAIPVVLDPVIRASNGGLALDEAGLALLRKELLPLVTLVKPNIAEAALLLGAREAATVDEMQQQARRLAEPGAGPRGGRTGAGAWAVLLSGGHLPGKEAVDIFCQEGEIVPWRTKKLENSGLHGTGCSLTASIAAGLARGQSLVEAVERAQRWLSRLMEEDARRNRAGQPWLMDHMATFARKPGG